MNGKTVFTGGTLITTGGESQKDLVIEDSKIADIRDRGPLLPGETGVDCAGLYVGPGLVDIHVHGGAGCDFVSNDPKEILGAVNYHLRQGTTSIIPSALSIPFDELRRAISTTREAASESDATVLGYHVEGIYFDQTYRGGHLSEYVHDPDPAEYMPLIQGHGDFIRLWTLAVERPGALDLIAECRKAGIVTSVGHSQASYEDIMRAVDAGLTHSTHFVCVMGSLSMQALGNSTGKGYAPGVVETVLLRDELTTEVIADGFHLHPAIIQLAVKCKGLDKVCLVSDAMKGAGLPDGDYFIGGQVSEVRGGIAIIKDRPEVIASSVTPLMGMLRFTHRKVGLRIADAWTMASLNPARVVGAHGSKGSLEIDKDADVLILDRDLNVSMVYAKGCPVHLHM
jgi:N-acetylglucosamine-6-phosphate deacetylase